MHSISYRISLFPIAIFLFLFLATNLQAAELSLNKVVAVVNGEAVTMHDLRKRIAAEMQRRGIRYSDVREQAMQQDVLDSMINDILLRHEAARYNITVDESDLSGEIRRIRENMGNISQEEFAQQLIQQGTNIEQAKEQIRKNILRQRIITFMISRKVIITREEIKDYYEEHKAEFATGKTADFSIIVFPPNFNANKIYADLRSGSANFEAVARQYSLDPSASNGGRVPSVAWGALSANMRSMLGALQPGGYSSLIPFQGASVLVRLNKISDGSIPTFEQAYTQIEGRIKEPRLQERFTEYTTQLRAKAVVDVRL